jgi:hypothetical protein
MELGNIVRRVEIRGTAPGVAEATRIGPTPEVREAA